MTLKLLEDMDIRFFVVDRETTREELRQALEGFQEVLSGGKSVAFVVRKGALSYDGEVTYKNGHTMTREEIIRHIAAISGEDPIVSTTGKASRELFEIRTAMGQGHPI